MKHIFLYIYFLVTLVDVMKENKGLWIIVFIIIFIETIDPAHKTIVFNSLDWIRLQQLKVSCDFFSIWLSHKSIVWIQRN